jgi:hypothetical protein
MFSWNANITLLHTAEHNCTSIIINNAGNRNGSYPLLYIEQYNIRVLRVYDYKSYLSSYMTLPQITKYRKIQYKNDDSCVQVVRTSVNKLGDKRSIQKT